jgi:hypothetical protein
MSKFDNILSRQLTRKEFLLTIGLAIVGIFGISSLLGVLSGSTKDPKARDYGSNTYGGDNS